MAKKFLTPINILNLSSDPASANEGDIYYNTSSDVLRIYANSSWANVSSGGGASLPDQTGNNGKYLTTDGTNASWGVVDLSAKANDNEVVHLAGTETITGDKTISGSLTTSGVLRATGSVTQTAQGIDRIDIGVEAGSPRMVFEDSGNPIWLIDNNAGVFRWYNPGVVRMSLDDSGNLDVTGSLTATSKSFDIEHPTKENMRLRYGSLEGPELAVYVRGRSNSSTITLPDYWTGLVDEDSITVQLTPAGKRQNLFVEDIADNTVIVGGVEGEFFYFIQAERKDIDKLVVEYGS